MIRYFVWVTIFVLTPSATAESDTCACAGIANSYDEGAQCEVYSGYEDEYLNSKWCNAEIATCKEAAEHPSGDDENRYGASQSACQENACAERGTSRQCNAIQHRESCLTSTESRSAIIFGNNILGSDCVWCPDGPCTGNNQNRCEPKNWMEGQGLNNFETCLKGYSMDYEKMYAYKDFCKGQHEDWTLEELRSMRPDLADRWFMDQSVNNVGAGVCYVANDGGIPACASICQSIQDCAYFSTSETTDCYACFIYKSCENAIQTKHDYQIYRMTGKEPDRSCRREGELCDADDDNLSCCGGTGCYLPYRCWELDGGWDDGAPRCCKPQFTLG